MASAAECLSPTFPWRRAWSCLMVWQLTSLGCYRGVLGTAGGSSGAAPDFCIIVALEHACITCTSTHAFTHVYTHTYAHTYVHTQARSPILLCSMCQTESYGRCWNELCCILLQHPGTHFRKIRFSQSASSVKLAVRTPRFPAWHWLVVCIRVCVCAMTKCVCGTFVFCISC